MAKDAEKYFAQTFSKLEMLPKTTVCQKTAKPVNREGAQVLTTINALGGVRRQKFRSMAFAVACLPFVINNRRDEFVCNAIPFYAGFGNVYA